MDATFLAKIKGDRPELRFVTGRKFAFRPPRTVVVGPEEPHDSLLLLHEVGHALCGHVSFSTGVERVRCEMEAWGKARELAARYGVPVDEGVVEGELDTYREWLHQKSRCPRCGLTRFQTPDEVWHCPKCENLG